MELPKLEGWTIGRRGDTVVLFTSVATVGLRWPAALLLYRALRSVIDDLYSVWKADNICVNSTDLGPGLVGIDVRIQRAQLPTIPFTHADRVARAIYVKAREAEEQDKANQICDDAALLARQPIPFGLTDNLHIQREAIRRAEYLPGPSIPSSVRMGTPKLIQGAPPSSSSEKPKPQPKPKSKPQPKPQPKAQIIQPQGVSSNTKPGSL